MFPICVVPSSFFFSCKDKPGVAEKILVRTYNFTCPLTDRIMYEDMDYKSCRTDSSNHTSKRKCAAEQERVLKPAKKVKVLKVEKLGGQAGGAGGAAGEGGQGRDKPFSSSQLKTLGKIKLSYEKLKDDFVTDKEYIHKEQLKVFIPAHLLAKQESHLLALCLEVSELDINLEAGAGEMASLKELHTATKLASGLLRTRMSTAIEEAGEAKLEQDAAAGGA